MFLLLFRLLRIQIKNEVPSRLLYSVIYLKIPAEINAEIILNICNFSFRDFFSPQKNHLKKSSH